MQRFNQLQISITTGRFLLPVVAFFCLLLWGLGWEGWLEGATLLVSVLTAYLLIEWNTAFSLIRRRTTFHISLYIYLATMCFFLHPWKPLVVVPLLFLVALFALFKSYESRQAPVHTFNAFFALGLGSLLFPQLLFFVPLFYIGMLPFRAFSARSFFAGIVGWSVPYWFLLGHAFYHDQMPMFYEPFRELVHFQPIDYTALSLEQGLNGGAITLLSLVGSVNCLNVSYLDKVRTRIYLSFLIAVEVWIYLLCILQPQHFDVLLSMQIILCSILAGHLFVLTRNRFTGIFFIVSFVMLIALMLFNLWMQFFNS